VDSLQKSNKKYIRLAALVLVAVTLTACMTTSTLPDPIAAGWNGIPVCESLHEDAKQRIFRCTFPPNVGHERHFHAPNFGYAISGGRMRITDETGIRELDLPDGSSFFSAGIEWHEVLNIGATTVVYLIVEAK
jgi:hypothetical protein